MGLKSFEQCQHDFLVAYDGLVEERKMIRHQHAPRLSALIAAEGNFKRSAEDLAKAMHAAESVGEAKAHIPA